MPSVLPNPLLTQSILQHDLAQPQFPNLSTSLAQPQFPAYNTSLATSFQALTVTPPQNNDTKMKSSHRRKSSSTQQEKMDRLEESFGSSETSEEIATVTQKSYYTMSKRFSKQSAYSDQNENSRKVYAFWKWLSLIYKF